MTDSKPVLPPAFWADLAIENPLGIPITEQDARDWFDLTWPTMREWYAENAPRQKPRWRLRITKWWSNLSERDLMRCRERGQRVRHGAQAASMAETAAEIPETDFDRLPDDFVIPPPRVH